MSAQPKIQKMCEEESDDHEAVAKLLEINDSIHRTIERYKLMKKGDIEGANKIPKGTLGTSGAGVAKGANNELSLIDLGGEDDAMPASEPSSFATASGAPAPKGNALEDDLLGLTIGDTYGQGGNIALGNSNGINASGSTAPPQQHLSNAQITNLFNQPQQPVAARPASGTFGGLNRNTPPTSSPAPPTSFSPPPPTIHQQPPAPKADPFASLTPKTSRTASPFQFQQSTHPPPIAVPDQQKHQPTTLLGSLTSPPISAPPTASTITTTPTPDDEWTFASALPNTSTELTVHNSTILITWFVSRAQHDPSLVEITSKISNNTAQPITELTFQVAVTRSVQLRLEPQSGRVLGPGQRDGITQNIKLLGVGEGAGTGVRMRWKVSYVVGGGSSGRREEEKGEVSGLGIP